jgi:hypothetical protein
MNDIQRQDMRLFVRELFRPGRIFLLLVVVAFFAMWVSVTRYGTHWPIGFVVALISAAIWAASAFNASKQKRFYSKRFESMWTGCKDRLARFEEVLNKMRREQVADLHEMPRTIRRVGDNLYLALRRADMITVEVNKTEKDMYGGPPIWQSPPNDPQAKELYRIADKNIAEYRQQFAGVMAGVHRAEAQSAVFMTTLDSLRMKMIGYRLVGKNPEMSSQDFLEALGEAKLQLHAIDQALDELDFSQMPQMIAVVPPPIPEELRQGN